MAENYIADWERPRSEIRQGGDRSLYVIEKVGYEAVDGFRLEVKSQIDSGDLG